MEALAVLAAAGLAVTQQTARELLELQTQVAAVAAALVALHLEAMALQVVPAL
jgi:hypothetical protein